MQGLYFFNDPKQKIIIKVRYYGRSITRRQLGRFSTFTYWLNWTSYDSHVIRSGASRGNIKKRLTIYLSKDKVSFTCRYNMLALHIISYQLLLLFKVGSSTIIYFNFFLTCIVKFFNKFISLHQNISPLIVENYRIPVTNTFLDYNQFNFHLFF